MNTNVVGTVKFVTEISVSISKADIEEDIDSSIGTSSNFSEKEERE